MSTQLATSPFPAFDVDQPTLTTRVRSGPDPGRRGDPRVPLEGGIRLVFGDFSDFLACCTGNISLGGMFLATADPLPLDSTFDFDLLVGDGLTLVRGQAKVVWIRSGGETPGMGLRFLDLDPIGFELIYRTVDRHIQAGGDPFDLDSARDRALTGTTGYFSPDGPRRHKPASDFARAWHALTSKGHDWVARF